MTNSNHIAIEQAVSGHRTHLADRLAVLDHRAQTPEEISTISMHKHPLVIILQFLATQTPIIQYTRASQRRHSIASNNNGLDTMLMLKPDAKFSIFVHSIRNSIFSVQMAQFSAKSILYACGGINSIATLPQVFTAKMPIFMITRK